MCLGGPSGGRRRGRAYPVALASSGADPCSTLGGIIPHFYRFFGILKFWGVYSDFNDFSDFDDYLGLRNFGVISGFNENRLEQMKKCIKKHNIN